jgi:GTP 3',8-cyclase
MHQLIDTFGRTVTNVRLSVTDRCNFRCTYCMPEAGMEWMERDKLLRYEELARLVRIFASFGISRVRLTGGEPLMRKELWKLVGLVRAIRGIEDIALTTNGYFLKVQARQLVDAGLNESMSASTPLIRASSMKWRVGIFLRRHGAG